MTTEAMETTETMVMASAVRDVLKFTPADGLSTTTSSYPIVWRRKAPSAVCVGKLAAWYVTLFGGVRFVGGGRYCTVCNIIGQHKGYHNTGYIKDTC